MTTKVENQPAKELTKEPKDTKDTAREMREKPDEARELKVWLDGRLVDKRDARISVYDHGLLYGDGVFEGIRVYHGRVFEFDVHLDRLWDSAKAIRLTI